MRSAPQLTFSDMSYILTIKKWGRVFPKSGNLPLILSLKVK